MWRIRLTTDDMARVRLARGADPMWEILHSVHLLGSVTGEELFGQWRRRCLRRPIRGLDALTVLAPAVGYSPDFLTPASGSRELGAGIESVLSTPRDRLREDLGKLTEVRRCPRWLADLAAARPNTLRGLGALLHRYFSTALADVWSNINAQVGDELLRCGRNLAAGGVEHLLGTVSPQIGFEAGTLLLHCKTGETDLRLDGRGIVLQPSFFAYEDVTILRTPDQPVVLAYPLPHRIQWSSADPSKPERPLDALIGRTRSRALKLLAVDAHTTTELAGHLELSIASASHQARVLREAGLIVSAQQGKAVVHRVSALGSMLLDRSPA